VIFLGVWILTFALFSLHLSALLLQSPRDALSLFLVITVPFLCGYGIIWAINARLRPDKWQDSEVRRHFSLSIESRLDSLRRKLLVFSCIWAAISVVEIVASRGLPIVWLFTGSGLRYSDFGIPSLHGFTNSLLLATSLVSTGLYFHTGRRRFLIMPVVSLLWSVVVISRNLLLVNVLQMFLLWMRFYARNIVRTLARSLLFALAILYVFGVVGDIRTGARNFINVAQPTVEIPAWVPSGFFWAYMYLTTPANNMLYDVLTVRPLDTGALPNTLSLLLPSVLRTTLLPNAGDSSANLVAQAFNVSSAYEGPYQDEGVPGIFVYSALIALVSTIFWYKRSLIGYFGYCVLAQCIFFSNFYNHFLYLPVVFQFFWFYVYRTRFTRR